MMKNLKATIQIASFTLFSLFFITHNALGQGYGNFYDGTPSVATPNAYAFLKNGLFPVNLFNGQANIDIPLATIIDGDIEIPLSLTYNTSGIKVEEEASWVGLGWNLNVGGSINHRYIGEKDDPFYFNYNSNSYFWDGLFLVYPIVNNAHKMEDYHSLRHIDPILSSSELCYTIEDAINGKMKPDMYSYNFFGHSGEFMYRYANSENTSDTILILNRKENINFYYNAPQDYWVAKDELGNVYYFSIWDPVETNTGYGGENYYLEKAVFSGKYEVNFQYDELLGTKITRYHRYENLVSTSANIEENDINKYNADFYYPRYLKTITTPNFTITFNRDTREDINGEERLESILITDNQGNDKLITFHNESYFATASNETVGAYYSSHNGVPSSPKRLKLDGVTITANNSEEPKVYSFDYNPEPLPSKASYARDYWGYYNGSLGNSRLIPNMDKIYGFDKDMYFEIPPGLRTAGSNRAADEHFMQAGILTSVTFPTGGKTIFEYEAHKFENYYLEEANIEVISGNVNPSSPGTAQRSPILSFDRPTQLTINAGISYGGAPSDSPYTKYETIKHSYVKLINLTNGTETKLIDPIDLAYDVCDFDDDPNNLPHCEEYAGYPGFKINGYKIIVDEGDFQIEVYKSDSSTVYCSESAYYSYKQKQPYSVGGGLRVKSITSLKNGSPTLKKEYIYNGDELGLGHLMVKPTYFKKETKFYMEGLVPTRDWYSLGSNSNIALKDYASGGQVGYANVREKFVDCIDPNKTYYIDHIYNLHPPLISNFSEMAPPVMQADNGLEYRTEFYDNNDNLVKSIANGYDIDYTGSYAGVFGENFTAEMPVNEVCFAFHQMNYSRGSQYGQLKAHFYSIPVYSIDKTHTLSTTYLNDQLEVSEFKSFEYNYLKQLVKTTTENSKGEKITEITYPFDTVKNGSNNIFNDMYLNNALAKPVQVKEYNNGKLLNKINYNYAEYQNSSTGESTFKSTSKAIDFPGTTDLDNKVNYIYNAEGVLIQANKENDIVTSLIWGHAGKTKLLAKLENITYDNIPVDVITKLEEFDDTDITTKLDIVNSFIRSHESMKDALVTTYTYNLLHGVSTITDPRGRTTYYKYDSMGRLWRILDHDKNVIEQYEYNYRQ